MSGLITLEISEFIRNPIRTGIQRVVRELIAKWPSDRPVRFAAFDPALDAFYELPDRAVDAAVAGAQVSGAREAEINARVAAADAPNRRVPLVLAPDERLLVPEVFYDPARMAFYKRLREQNDLVPSVVVHDFSAYLNPNAFKITQGGSNFFLPYLYFVRHAAKRSFTSEVAVQEFGERITRTGIRHPGDLVARLGADGPKIPRQSWSPSRRTLLSIGSLDGKKNQEMLYDAYAASPRLQEAFSLLFIGRKPEHWQSACRAIFDSELPKVSVLDDASDGDLCEAFGQARATVFISTAEGFGLPAVESLAAGVPVVVWAGLPALKGLPDTGQIRVASMSVEDVRCAIETLIDDDVAAAAFEQLDALRLDTWADYARKIADWMDG